MNTLNLELYLEDDISEALHKYVSDEDVLINFADKEWQVKLQAISVFSNVRGEFTDKSYRVSGVVFNKSERDLRHAKAEVRRKQQEFKEAQRKLSELMDNTN